MNQPKENTTVNRSVSFVDRLAIGFSMLCVLHCLLTPTLLVALPSLGATFLAEESFHFILVYLVIPTSLFALSLGCKQHNRWVFFGVGVVGLLFLLMGISVEALEMDHHWETIFTLIGASLIACAHVFNFTQCRKAATHGDC